MDAWNVALLAAAAYVAITALVRLMIRRRNAGDGKVPSRGGEGKTPQGNRTGQIAETTPRSGRIALVPPTMLPKRLYIQTVGCQMNVLDSELVAAELAEAGYELVKSLRQADAILLNTCSVRQHAEDKVYTPWAG